MILEDMKISIACISETWFDTKSGKFSKSIKEAGYELYHAYREGKRDGGVAILYMKKMNVKGRRKKLFAICLVRICLHNSNSALK